MNTCCECGKELVYTRDMCEECYDIEFSRWSSLTDNVADDVAGMLPNDAE